MYYVLYVADMSVRYGVRNIIVSVGILNQTANRKNYIHSISQKLSRGCELNTMYTNMLKHPGFHFISNEITETLLSCRVKYS